MCKAMENMGFKRGNVLEPSCGVGNFLGMLPDSMRESQLYVFEVFQRGSPCQTAYPAFVPVGNF